MEHSNTEEYNNEPVFYCEHCLSLLVQTVGNIDYCGQCSSTDIKTTNIEDWEHKFEAKYGKKHIEK